MVEASRSPAAPWRSWSTFPRNDTATSATSTSAATTAPARVIGDTQTGNELGEREDHEDGAGIEVAARSRIAELRAG